MLAHANLHKSNGRGSLARRVCAFHLSFKLRKNLVCRGAVTGDCFAVSQIATESNLVAREAVGPSQMLECVTHVAHFSVDRADRPVVGVKLRRKLKASFEYAKGVVIATGQQE